MTSKISKRQDFFPGGPVVKTACDAGGTVAIPGPWTKIPQTTWCSPKKGKINTLKKKKKDLPGAFVLGVDRGAPHSQGPCMAPPQAARGSVPGQQSPHACKSVRKTLIILKPAKSLLSPLKEQV